jgi:hypothetical protein
MPDGAYECRLHASGGCDDFIKPNEAHAAETDLARCLQGERASQVCQYANEALDYTNMWGLTAYIGRDQ